MQPIVVDVGVLRSQLPLGRGVAPSNLTLDVDPLVDLPVPRARKPRRVTPRHARQRRRVRGRPTCAGPVQSRSSCVGATNSSCGSAAIEIVVTPACAVAHA